MFCSGIRVGEDILRTRCAQNWGILIDGTVRSVTNSLVKNNRVKGAGQAGILVTGGACGNTFIGNNLQGNADDIGAVFDVNSGANTLVGNKNVVIDNGDFDCDNDGLADPNFITGNGQVLKDPNLGQIVSEAVSSGVLQ